MYVSERPVPTDDSTHFGIIRRWAVKDDYIVSVVTQRSERETPPFGGSKLIYMCSRHAMGCRCIEAVKAQFPERSRPTPTPESAA